MSEMPQLRVQYADQQTRVTSAPLLVTKLQPPRTAPIASRTRLLMKLSQPASVTLVTAPAGTGKTTAVLDWFRRCTTPTSWLTMDDEDNDPYRFTAYLSSALGQPCESISIERALVSLINHIAQSRQTHALVLDDYHFIVNPEAHQIVAFLLEHLPTNLHLIVIGRVQPALPLARQRVAGRLNHIRSRDLAFLPEEAMDLMHHCYPQISTSWAALSETEGWAAGLQLHAVAYDEGGNPSECQERWRQYLREYLVQEILSKQPVELQSFLLQTSLLEYLSVETCEALTGRLDSRSLLQSLHAEGLFTRYEGAQTYRYEVFFRDSLREHFALTAPEHYGDLLGRVSLMSGMTQQPDTPVIVSVPLSEREREVLALLADGHSSPEIAQKMIIAVSTVKTHIKHIYRKLEVDNRYQALNRARELNLLQIEMEKRYQQLMR